MVIPEAKQPAVARALKTAFGTTEYEEISLLSGGLSTALACKIVVREKPYLLKIMRTEVISDPAQEFAIIQTAAEAGIAPLLWYANVADRILITDFVESKPFPGNQEMALLIAPILRRLHSLPNFPIPKMGNYINTMDGLVRRFQSAKILPESATEEIFRSYADLIKAYPRKEGDLVASHNDLKPQNMRFDGNRLWLVDWESAFLNDEYVDLAIAANFFVENDTQEEDYLRAYFGEAAGEYRRARFYLMRQALSMFYAAFLLLGVSRAGLTVDFDFTQLPDFRDYHQDLISDKIDMKTDEAKLQYGIIHLREALRKMRRPRFEEALDAVAEFDASA